MGVKETGSGLRFIGMEAKTLYVFPACPKCNATSGVWPSKFEQEKPSTDKLTVWWCVWCGKSFKAKASEAK